MNFPWMPFPNPPNSETETHSELCFQALLKTLSHQPLFTSMFHWHCWESYLNECPGGFSFWVFGFGFILHICICRDMTWSFILVFFFLMKHACTNVGFCWFANMCVEKPKCQCGKMGTGGAQESLLWMHGRPTKRRMVVLMFPKILYR